MSARSTKGPAPEAAARAPGNLADDVVVALTKLAAGLWLLDALHSGELLQPKTEPVPWWVQWPFPMTAEELHGWLEDMALRYAAEALDEGYREAVALFERLRAAEKLSS
jgi:hypothetical protein